MAVIQISKIQVRRGLQENLPQLAGGEFGWSVDTQRLYIGNGTITEGAPAVGNTEILTSTKDILSAIQSYQFKGEETSYSSQTGVSRLSPVLRSLQYKLDEYVSVKDFGAAGDGSTDDTQALQRAIDQVYPLDYFTTSKVRRRLRIPAGVYKITANLTIPPYAAIFGDGPKSSVILKTYGTDPVVYLRDSRGALGNLMNTTTSFLPFQVDFRDLGFQTSLDNTIAQIDSAQDVSFTRVNFTGNLTTPITTANSKSAITVVSNQGSVQNIYINDCRLSQITYGISLTGHVKNVTVNSSTFSTMYQGLVATANINSPYAVRVTSSGFDNIAKQAIYSGNSSHIISAFNHFGNCGYGDGASLVSASANTAILSWTAAGNHSIADNFDRSTANAAIKPLIEILGTGATRWTTQTTSGALSTVVGLTDTIVGNTNVASNLALTLNNNTINIIDYSISRLGGNRIGTIKVTQINGTATYEDDFIESADTGVILDFATFASNVIMTYTASSSSPKTDGTIKYSLRSFI